MTANVNNAVMIEDRDHPESLDVHCEPCILRQSKLKISRELQSRVQDAAWNFHVGAQPITPPGPNGERYWIPIVDDATRFGRGISIQTKAEVSTHMIRFCEEMKLLTGRYPGYWRMDNGTEFKRFTSWGQERGMVFEITPA